MSRAGLAQSNHSTRRRCVKPGSAATGERGDSASPAFLLGNERPVSDNRTFARRVGEGLEVRRGCRAAHPRFRSDRCRSSRRRARFRWQPRGPRCCSWPAPRRRSPNLPRVRGGRPGSPSTARRSTGTASPATTGGSSSPASPSTPPTSRRWVTMPPRGRWWRASCAPARCRPRRGLGRTRRRTTAWSPTSNRSSTGPRRQSPTLGRRPALHRLNRAEYANAVRDLLGLRIDAAALLPPDDASYGFDNMGDVLRVSPALLDGYLRRGAHRRDARDRRPPRRPSSRSCTGCPPI